MLLIQPDSSLTFCLSASVHVAAWQDAVVVSLYDSHAGAAQHDRKRGRRAQ